MWLYQKMETAPCCSLHMYTILETNNSLAEVAVSPSMPEGLFSLFYSCSYEKVQWKQLKIICCNRKMWMIDRVIFATVGLKP